jgi:fused signal recognition particle receptor
VAEVVDEPRVTDGPVGVVVEEPPPTEAPPADAPEVLAAPPRFRDRLGRARSLFGGYLTSIRAKERIDEATWEELEEALILADVGAPVAAQMLDDLRLRVKNEGIQNADQLVEALKLELIGLLQGDQQLHHAATTATTATTAGEPADKTTTVWLFVGVNGVGKTTTIGKLGLRQAAAGHKVVMAAGDTFRAAAADQLEMWAGRVGATIIRGSEGGDPGAVVFDAVQHAAARGADLVLADTAGRLHTKTNLMEELKKVRRVAERPPGQVTEVLLVIDATTGQNGLVQARQFAEAVGVTGVVLTKLDGTAKGGIVVAIRSELNIPIKLVGLGEGAEDLVDFDAEEFVNALFDSEDQPGSS